MTIAFQPTRRRYARRALAAVVLSMFFLEPPDRINAAQAPSGDIDAFMAKVLARRKVNQDALKDYLLNDSEQFEAVGPGNITLFRKKGEYLWYVRDGVHVRSPVRIDGVTIGQAERKEYEDKWLKEEERREKMRAEAKAKSEQAAADGAATDQPPPDPGSPSFITQISEPRFISESYFLHFKFESGNYYFAGKEKFDGRDVLVIEYYPTDLFNESRKDGDNTQAEKKPEKEQSKKDNETEERINRQMNKTSLVTLWVDPAEYQIVKYAFSNVWMDFLPAAWMIRIDHLKASMEMSQAIPGVWLPRSLTVQAGLGLAVGTVAVRYDRRFSDYKRAEVTTTIRPIDQEK